MPAFKLLVNLHSSAYSLEQFCVAGICGRADNGILGVILRNNFKLRKIKEPEHNLQGGSSKEKVILLQYYSSLELEADIIHTRRWVQCPNSAVKNSNEKRKQSKSFVSILYSWPDCSPEVNSLLHAFPDPFYPLTYICKFKCKCCFKNT